MIARPASRSSRAEGRALVGLLVFAVTTACAEKGPREPTPTDAGRRADAGSDAAVLPPRDASFARPDRGPRPDTGPDLGECLPGTYAGTFECTLSFFGLPIAPYLGPMTLVLEPGETIEDPEFPVYTIAPGALLDATDNIGGRFMGSVEGQLDCRTRELAGTLVNAHYLYDNGFTGMLDFPLTGALMALYQAAALVEGTMGPLQSVEVPFAEASGCSWEAALQR